VSPQVERDHSALLREALDDVGPHVARHVDAVHEEYRLAPAIARSGVDAGEPARGPFDLEGLAHYLPPMTPGT
jgi:hypothetical protein